jgi:FKBP-type peptidyl-prolyl cis-trans isomerase (trigger factor)
LQTQSSHIFLPCAGDAATASADPKAAQYKQQEATITAQLDAKEADLANVRNQMDRSSAKRVVASLVTRQHALQESLRSLNTEIEAAEAELQAETMGVLEDGETPESVLEQLRANQHQGEIKRATLQGRVKEVCKATT